MRVKHIVTIICLTIGGCYAMYLEQSELAGVCFGAIAMWGFVNGAREAIKDKGEG